eukprot:m.49423 g.49423  ORF g.49423 m.49423 type:complete len:509 (-) comp13351_c0_seq16:2257-3783(-)
MAEQAMERIQRQIAEDAEKRENAGKPEQVIQSKPKEVSEAIQAGIAAGNINIHTSGVERMELTEEAQLQQDQQNELVDLIEKKKRGRTLKVPTNDNDVKMMLRKYEEPICLFAEGKADRRERLRELILERGPLVDEAMDTQEEQVQQPTNEIWYHQGSPALLAAREYLAQYSLPRANARLKAARVRLAKTDTDASVVKQKQSTQLQTFMIQSSQIGDTRPLSYCRFAPDGSTLAVSSWSGLVKLWSVPDSKLTRTYKGHTERVSALEWHPGSGTTQGSQALNLISGGTDGTVHFWNLEQDTPFHSLAGHEARVGRVRMHPSGRFLATTCFDHSWRLWDLEANEEVLHQEGHSREVYDVAFHPDGGLAGTTSLDCYGRVWDLRTGKNIMVLSGHRQKVLTLDFSPNGYHVATAGDDHTVRIWDLRKTACAYMLPAHTHLISQVKYHSSGNFFVTASYDGTAKLWRSPECTPLRTLKGHEGRIMSADVNPDATLIATAASDRTFKLWAAE